MQAGHTVKFNVDNGTFFSAYLDNGLFRIGMNGLKAFDLPSDHKYYNDAVNAKTAADVEEVFDLCMDFS